MRRLHYWGICFFIVVLVGHVGAAGRWWQAYFTRPTGKAGCVSPVEKTLVTVIDRARSSVYAALFELDSEAVSHALVRAHKRGIKVALVTDDNYMKEKALQSLIGAGVPVVSDERRGLMHNKFVIIDNTYLWTGSYNVTMNGACRNNNNVLFIKSPELSAIYFDEFREMFQYKIFGNRKEQTVFPFLAKKNSVVIGKTKISAYFSPDNNVEKVILEKVAAARRSIYFMAFSYTSDAIGEAMIARHKQGVAVSGLFEKRGANTKYSEYVKMKLENMAVKLDRNRYVMHHKVIIIDKKIVITGSYNFSKNASKKNDENVLVIENPDIAMEYFKEFVRLYR